MSKVNLKPTTTMFPLPAMLIICVDPSGKPNILKEKGRIDITKALPVAYCAGAHEYWGMGKKLGWCGYTKGKL